MGTGGDMEVLGMTLGYWLHYHPPPGDIYHAICGIFQTNLNFFKNKKMVQKSTFYLQNQNSETTFISSTLKVEEIKVVSEF